MSWSGCRVTIRTWRDERGFATILGAFAVAALVAVAIAVIYLGASVVARHRAQSAADLSALAAASDRVYGRPDPCGTARRIAAAQGFAVRVERCAASEGDIVVSVAVPVELGPFGDRAAMASARAGPVG